MTDKPFLTLKKPPLDFDKLNEFCEKAMEISKLLSQIESLVDAILIKEYTKWNFADSDELYEAGRDCGKRELAEEIKEILKRY